MHICGYDMTCREQFFYRTDIVGRGHVAKAVPAALPVIIWRGAAFSLSCATLRIEHCLFPLIYDLIIVNTF